MLAALAEATALATASLSAGMVMIPCTPWVTRLSKSLTCFAGSPPSLVGGSMLKPWVPASATTELTSCTVNGLSSTAAENPTVAPPPPPPPAAAPPLAAVEPPPAAALALLVAAGAAALVDVDEVSPKEHEVSTSSALAETAAAAIRPRLVVHSVRDN